jgi:hypothetical protein
MCLTVPFVILKGNGFQVSGLTSDLNNHPNLTRTLLFKYNYLDAAQPDHHRNCGHGLKTKLLETPGARSPKPVSGQAFGSLVFWNWLNEIRNDFYQTDDFTTSNPPPVAEPLPDLPV